MNVENGRITLISEKDFIWKHACRSNNFNEQRKTWAGWKVIAEFDEFYQDKEYRLFQISFPDECNIEPIIIKLNISSGKEILFPTSLQNLCRQLAEEIGLDFYIIFQALDINQNKKMIEHYVKQIIPEITVDRLVKQRTKQSQYRNNVLKLWGNRCAILGTDFTAMLIASHIKPFSLCENEEFYNPANGLTLCVHLDKLFDRGYISFDNNGKIIISEHLNSQILTMFNINNNLKLQFNFLTDKDKKHEILEFLEFHRKNIFQAA
ncbi:HNH endonuclease [Wielerella bovis]|uniref:HNH endonuclease n=1 Tax=Wielerella bovis TaxID=2917790 RepID=UPI00201A0A1E|nr:HNH endonuclease [Wielerella bovis]ULJ62545.1 HNH endonuclease [Wielerella bovis]